MLQKRHHSFTFQISNIEEDIAEGGVGMHAGADAAGGVVKHTAPKSVTQCANTVLASPNQVAQ